VEPPLKVVAESAVGSAAWGDLKSQIERKLRDVLSIAASVELVPAGTLPRYEMKGQLVKHLQNKVQDVAGQRRKVLV
jgi:phenylacetate-CoA ligase